MQPVRGALHRLREKRPGGVGVVHHLLLGHRASPLLKFPTAAQFPIPVVILMRRLSLDGDRGVLGRRLVDQRAHAVLHRRVRRRAKQERRRLRREQPHVFRPVPPKGPRVTQREREVRRQLPLRPLQHAGEAREHVLQQLGFALGAVHQQPRQRVRHVAEPG